MKHNVIKTLLHQYYQVYNGIYIELDQQKNYKLLKVSYLVGYALYNNVILSLKDLNKEISWNNNISYESLNIFLYYIIKNYIYIILQKNYLKLFGIKKDRKGVFYIGKFFLEIFFFTEFSNDPLTWF